MTFSNKEYGEKYRAEAFRHLGYACCTPFGLTILGLLLNQYQWNDIMTVEFLGSLVALIIGFRVINIGYEAMDKLDRRTELIND